MSGVWIPKNTVQHLRAYEGFRVIGFAIKGWGLNGFRALGAEKKQEFRGFGLKGSSFRSRIRAFRA